MAVPAQQARSDDIVQTERTCAEALLAFLEGGMTLFGAFDTDLDPWFRPTRDQFQVEGALPRR